MVHVPEYPFYVKDCGMVEKKEGKEKEKCSTMPDVLIKGYKILRTVSVGQDFSIAEVEHMRVASFDSLRFLAWSFSKKSIGRSSSVLLG